MGVSGINHVALSVSDLAVSGPWYEKVLGAQKLMSTPDEEIGPLDLFLIPDTLLVGLRQHNSTPAGDEFAPQRVGLDHLGIQVADRAELEKWQATLEEHGVENSGIVETPAGLHLNFKDPDRIALEFFVMPG